MNADAAAARARQWRHLALAWLALCCGSVLVAHVVWPGSTLARAVPVAAGAVGGAVLGHLDRRNRPAGSNRAASVAILIVLGVTLSTLLLALPPISAFGR